MVVTEAQLEALKELLGRRRYRVAMLSLGRGLKQREISRRLRVSQRTIRRDLSAVKRQFEQLRRSARLKVHLHASVPGLN